MSPWAAAAYFPHMISAPQQLSSGFRSVKSNWYEIIRVNVGLLVPVILIKLG